MKEGRNRLHRGASGSRGADGTDPIDRSGRWRLNKVRAVGFLWIEPRGTVWSGAREHPPREESTVTNERRSSLWRPDFDPGDEAEFQTLRVWDDLPASTYLSVPGADYYRLDESTAGRPIPSVEPVRLRVELLGLRSEAAGVDDPVTERLRALRYTSSAGVVGVFALMGSEIGSPFMRGRLLTFGYVYNPDPGSDGVAVHRVVGLGLRRPPRGQKWGDFAFIREIDTYGSGFPPVTDRVDDFQIVTTPAAHGLLKDIIFEAGSPAAMG